MAGLNVNRLVSVTVNLQPIAVARKTFGILMIAGDSDVIDASERYRSYTDIDSVAADFGTTAPEYLAASLYFGQSPRPKNLMVGRWLRTASSGFVKGAVLTAAEQTLSNWTAITTGAFKIDIDGSTVSVSGLDFHSVTNLNGVASAIDSALTGATCTWDGERFKIVSDSTGVNSKVGYAVAPTSGTDISALLKLTSATATAVVDGAAAETPVECATVLANLSGQWYGLTFAADTMPTDDQLVAVAAFIEGTTIARIFGVTAVDTRTLDSTYTTDIASRLKALNYTRSCVQYSSSSDYAIASMIGRAFSVNFNANKTTITLMYKQEPGVLYESLSESQAQALAAKNCNVYVLYNNDTYIIQYGKMCSGAYFDERHGLDWLADAIQTDLYNVLYQSTTKIPQTDAGQNILITQVQRDCDQAVANGLVAPGVWNADGFGQLNYGDYLAKGYYIYSIPMADQAQADREARKAPPIQVAVKLAGAIHTVDCIINVNR